MIKPKWYRLILIGTALVLTTSCSEFALLASGASIAGTQNMYVKAYNGADILTIMYTDKDIKKHVYDELRKQKKSKYEVLFKGKE
jgi:hypothetical protein